MKQPRSLYSYWSPRYWPTWIGLGILRLLCLLPHSARLAVGSSIGRLAHRLGGKRRAIVRRNIELCFPELTVAERDTLAKQHFLALGMSLIEMGIGRWASDQSINSLCDIEGINIVKDAQAKGQGVILLGAHFTTLEVSGRAVRNAGAEFDAVFRRNRSDFITEFLRSGRERSANQVIEKRDIKTMVRRLRAGKSVWYAPDQSFKRKGAEVVPFFGIPTMHITATSTLARLGKAIVIPFFSAREADGRYLLKFYPPFEDFPTDDPVADLAVYMDVLEPFIRDYPEQYFWIHRKFKDLPAGYQDYYADLDAAK
ncbi:MAG: lipid A biosynthesis lauroyl acyltransferase [Woeseiaceae bacterium]